MTIEERVRRVLTDAVADEPPPRVAPLQATIRRRRRRPVLAGATAVVLVLAAVAGLVALRRPEDRAIAPAAPTYTTLPTTGWPQVVDDAANFRFRYPPGWQARRIHTGMWALTPEDVSRTGEGLPGFEVRVTSTRSLWKSRGYWHPAATEVGRLPGGQAYLLSFHDPSRYGVYAVDWGRRCTGPAAPGSCRPQSVEVEFRSFDGRPWDRYRAQVQTMTGTLRPQRPQAPTVGDRSRPACRAGQWELARPDVHASLEPDEVAALPVGVRFRGGRPCHLRATVSMAALQEGRLVEVRGNPAPATIELDLPEDALPATYVGADIDRMLQLWIWERPCQSPRPPPNPMRFLRRVDLVFSDDRGRRLVATHYNQGSDTGVCGDPAQPSVVRGWP